MGQSCGFLHWSDVFGEVISVLVDWRAVWAADNEQSSTLSDLLRRFDLVAKVRFLVQLERSRSLELLTDTAMFHHIQQQQIYVVTTATTTIYQLVIYGKFIWSW